MAKIIQINDLKQLGGLVRAARKFQHLRQDEVGRFSHSFIGELEAGKPTAQIGKVLEAMRELGIRLHVELPAGMNAPPRELVASVNGREVGVLRERASLWSFQYSASWLDAADGFDLSPALQRAAGEIVDGARNPVARGEDRKRGRLRVAGVLRP